MRQNADRMNRLQIREQEHLNRERQAQADAQERRRAEAVQKSKNQYNHVRSHGYGPQGAASGGTAASPGDDVQIRVYVRECDTDGARSYSYMENEGIAESRLGTAASPLAANARGPREPQTRLPPVQRVPRQGVSSAERAAPQVPNKGKVPRYLQQRKAELAAEKRSIEVEAELRRELAKIPPGHRIVTDQERAETLATLDERQAELEAMLGKIPIRFDTQAIRNRRSNIEEEMREIEATRLKYSAKKPLYLPLE